MRLLGYLSSMAIILFSMSMYKLYAVLDGRVTPIYLASRYTFSNFEWARGNVYFKKGFDLPLNGTAILDVSKEVQGSIGFHNSTLTLYGKLQLSENSTFTGAGYIDARGSVIFFRQRWIPEDNKTFSIISNVTFEGNGANYFAVTRAGSFVRVNDNVAYVQFKRFNYGPFFGGRFKTKVNAPQTILFSDCTITLFENGEINSSSVVFDGDVKILRSSYKKLTLTSGMRLNPFSSLHVQSGTTLQAPFILSSGKSSELIIDNATLSYLPTGTFVRIFERANTGGFHEGTLTVRGQSQLVAPVGTEILLDKNSDLVCNSASTLKVNAGIIFRVA